jgi:soluble lytic murein transglycosylase-like protein
VRIPDVIPPEGVSAAKARVSEIRRRFGEFESVLSAAASHGSQVDRGRVEDAVAKAAVEYGVDADLLLAVAEVESGFRPDAVSSKGALGVMQLMPSTAARMGVADALNPDENIDGGARYLREQMERFGGDLSLALAAYNAGPAAVSRHGGVPPYGETQRFVSRVLSRVAAMRADP